MYKCTTDCEVRGKAVKAGDVIDFNPKSRFFKPADAKAKRRQTNDQNEKSAEPSFDEVPGREALVAAEIDSLEKLRETMKTENWHKSIPGVGDATVKLIVAFLK